MQTPPARSPSAWPREACRVCREPAALSFSSPTCFPDPVPRRTRSQGRASHPKVGWTLPGWSRSALGLEAAWRSQPRWARGVCEDSQAANQAAVVPSTVKSAAKSKPSGHVWRGALAEMTESQCPCPRSARVSILASFPRTRVVCASVNQERLMTHPPQAKAGRVGQPGPEPGLRAPGLPRQVTTHDAPVSWFLVQGESPPRRRKRGETTGAAALASQSCWAQPRARPAPGPHRSARAGGRLSGRPLPHACLFITTAT